MTVSLVLKKHPKISAETRARVYQVIEKLGYRPDPMLASLVAYRHTTSKPHYVATLGWLTNFGTQHGWKEFSYCLDYYHGASRRASELGYQMDEFWIREPGISPDRLSDILLNRGIEGVLIPPLPFDGSNTVQLRWERFAAITFGYSLQKPSLHLVTFHHFKTMVLAMTKLRELGYRRIGLVFKRSQDERVGHEHVAAYLMEHYLHFEGKHLPVFYEEDENEFRDWMHTHEPDAILTLSPQPFLDWLAKLKIKVPQDLGVAFLALYPKLIEMNYAGIYQEHELIGVHAADLLAGMLHRNERGIPPRPQRVLLEPVWMEGKSVRKQKPG